MSRYVTKRDMKSTTATKTFCCKGTKPDKSRESKQFIKILREAYERHVRSYRRSISPPHQINTCIDIVSFFVPKKLQTPKITDVQLSKYPIIRENRYGKKILERYSHKPLPNIDNLSPRIKISHAQSNLDSLKNNKENISEIDPAFRNRISEYRHQKGSLVKFQTKRLVTQTYSHSIHYAKQSRSNLSKLTNKKKDNKFSGWQNESYSEDEQGVWPR